MAAKRKTPNQQESLIGVPKTSDAAATTVTKVEPAASPIPAAAPRDLNVTVEVQPRQPRLAWHGVHNREIATAVPTQVVEIVRPGRDKGNAGLTPTRIGIRSEEPMPQNRLIWTNDNLVALQTLLDERDPETVDWRYRGKVDLVYIDPPFMVNSNFVADNTIDIDFDDEGHDVPVHKEPSLIEILAYKDTWRNGLDSFLSMLRARLVLLKDLLAPTGSIYVHLDWHAVHYVKVLMDEVFGYENTLAEVVWKRTSARGDTAGIGIGHDTIISYGAGSSVFWSPVTTPYSSDYIQSHYTMKDTKTGQRFRLDNLRSPNPRPNLMYEWKGYKPHKNGWAISIEEMARRDAAGLIYYPPKGERLAFKRFLDDGGMPLMSVWADLPPVNSQASERLGYPTQKPVALLERIIRASCPPGGLVLDCFNGSGTTSEAAERLGRRFIGIDNGKYAIHLARKRLIQLHNQPRPPEKAQHDYEECDKCGNIDRKERRQKSPGPFRVKPFTIENMGVYQQANVWHDAQTHVDRFREEMVRVYGGTPATASPLLHGIKGKKWVHVGPLDGPIATWQVKAIADAVRKTELKEVDILSADFNVVTEEERKDIQAKIGVWVTIRIIPAAAIEEVKRRLQLKLSTGDVYESMAIPAFYAPLSIVLGKPKAVGRRVSLTLERCEVDIDSFLASQRPLLDPVMTAKTDKQRKQRQDALDKWAKRQDELDKWLKKANTWTKFVDFWAIDWNYQSRFGPDGKPVLETEWQSFRERRGKETSDLVLTAEVTYEQAGHYQVAARVTDVFGNDGITTVDVEVR